MFLILTINIDNDLKILSYTHKNIISYYANNRRIF